MANFILCANGILPLLVLMLLGHIMRRTGFVSAEGFQAMDKLCFRVLIPVMLFQNVYTADFAKEFHLDAVIFMEVSILAVFAVTMVLIPRLLPGRNEDAATLIHGLCHGNLAVLGMPLIVNLFGADQVAVYSILMACTSPLINPLMVVEHLRLQGERVKPLQLIWNILKSPFLVGTLAGLFCALLRIRFPVFLNTAVTSLKTIASPLCLIALGGSFVLGDIRSYGKAVLGCVVGKCVVIPAIVLGIAVALGFRGIVLASLLIIFACPSAAATYSFCTGYCGNPAMASQIVVYSSAASIFTIFCWLFLFLQLGLI